MQVFVDVDLMPPGAEDDLLGPEMLPAATLVFSVI
jgi:hypothetical protein